MYLGIVPRVKATLLHVLGDARLEGASRQVQTVVLVGRLGQTLRAGLGGNGLTVRHDGLRDLYVSAAHVVLLEVLEADLQVELSEEK